MSLANQSKNIDGRKWSINHAKMAAFYGTCQSSKFGGIYGGILQDMSITSNGNTFGGKLIFDGPHSGNNRRITNWSLWYKYRNNTGTCTSSLNFKY